MISTTFSGSYVPLGNPFLDDLRPVNAISRSQTPFGNAFHDAPRHTFKKEVDYALMARTIDIIIV